MRKFILGLNLVLILFAGCYEGTFLWCRFDAVSYTHLTLPTTPYV